MPGDVADRAAACRRLCAHSYTSWLAGDGRGAWAALRAARDAAAGDPGLLVEVEAAASTVCLRAERDREALAAAERCLGLAGALPRLDGQQQMAVLHARVTRGTVLATDPAADEETHREALAELDAAAERATDEDVLARAVNNALMARLSRINRQLGDGDSAALVQAWLWVAQARSRLVGHPSAGVVVRQAVDLAVRTGSWERGWGHLTSYVDAAPERLEQVALCTKGALLAWERGDHPSAREFGIRALRRSVAVDQAWVRLYAHLGGVIAAAAGAGSLPAALEAYMTCTDRAGHASRPWRAWQTAQVALDAGVPPAQVRGFLARTHPDGLGHGLDRIARILLADAGGAIPEPADLATVNPAELDAADRARVLLARARALLSAGRRSAAAVDLHAARAILRDWPGRVLSAVETLAGAEFVSPTVPPAQGRVLDLLVEGLGNDQIASALGCSPRTVAVHVARLLRTTGARSRTELAVRVLRDRLLSAGATTVRGTQDG